MNTKEALAQLGITDDSLTPEQKQQFDERGYFLVPDFFSPAEVKEMLAEFERLADIEGKLGGHEVHIEPGAQRLSNLFNKSAAFDRTLACAPTLAAAHYLLGEIHVYSVNARTPAKGKGQQPLHADVPRTHPSDWRMINTMVMLDDMTEENGPTRIVPGSHRWSPINVPDVNMAEVKALVIDDETKKRVPVDPMAPYPGEVHLTGKAGSVAVLNGCMWHGGTTNVSGKLRRVLHIAVGRRDVPQQHVERDFVTPELIARSNAAQKYILDIENADAKVFGYPPLPKDPRTWAAAETPGTGY